MSFIKNNSKLFILILIAVLIGGGAYYYTSILSPQMENLQSLKEQNEAKRLQLHSLEEELRMFPERKNELMDMEMQVQALQDKVPSYQTSVMMMMEITQYMEAYDFIDMEINMGEPLEPEGVEEGYHTIPVTIKYTTIYDNTIKLLEEINRSYQMITIDYFSIDNSIQEETDKEGNKIMSADSVRTEVELFLHYKEGKDKEEYPNFMEFFNREGNVFLRSGGEEIDEEIIGAKSGLPSNVKAKDNTTFALHLADILRSGDNYSFSGYSPNKDPVYVGLTSAKDTKIVLTIRENGYSCLIEDSEGKQSEKKVDIKVKDPSINITSQIQKIMEEMPIVSIYVHNYTPNAIKVNMRGSLLNNVLIYNENGKIVPPGQQVGKVVLTI